MNSEYAEFIKSEGYTIPSNWVDGKYGDGKDELFTAPLSQMTHQKTSIVNNYTQREMRQWGGGAILRRFLPTPYL